jgi:serine/threonine protein kinase
MPGRHARENIFEPAKLVADRYEVVGRIGAGGMGDVYEVIDVTLGDRIALKTLRPEHAADSGLLERFRREVLLARRITHRNVCRVHDFGSHVHAGGGETHFLTMELLRGETLAHRLALRKRLPTDEAFPIAVQIAEGLAAAHRMGIIHRDLKTENVVLALGPQGERVVVMDFGLARPCAAQALATLTATGEILGTPAYMSPEQIRGAALTPATDTYAMGVVLYEMVTGQLPFGTHGNLKGALRKLLDPPRGPRSLAADVPQRWDEAILRCLALKPEKRFGSALDVVAALNGG